MPKMNGVMMSKGVPLPSPAIVSVVVVVVVVDVLAVDAALMVPPVTVTGVFPPPVNPTRPPPVCVEPPSDVKPNPQVLPSAMLVDTLVTDGEDELDVALEPG